MSEGVRMLTIAEHVLETSRVRSMLFDGAIDATPGQFVMIWVPGVDEFPMSVSFLTPKPGITYEVIGNGTRALADMKVGQKVGIRGPFGNGFRAPGERVLAIAGGTGIAAIAPFVERATWAGSSVELVLGARSADALVFEERCRGSGATVHVSTDDGSKGFKGLATELVADVVGNREFDSVHACGPEKMIAALLPICKARNLPMEASLERLIKCGIGVCDSCAIDGRRVCSDGPVFSMTQLEALEELAKTKRDASGLRVPI